jgi:hypothetical protein
VAMPSKSRIDANPDGREALAGMRRGLAAPGPMQ